MIHRVAAYALWGFFGWYAASYLLTMFGQQATFAPIGAVVMIAIAGVDWPALVRRSAVAPAPEPVDSPQ